MNTEEDYKITAYALGELQGKEKEEFEKELEQNPELQAEIDAIRAFSGDIEAEFKAEEELALNGTQRDEILKESRKSGIRIIPIALTAAAALVCVGLFVSTQTFSDVTYYKQEQADSKYKSSAIDREYEAPEAVKSVKMDKDNFDVQYKSNQPDPVPKSTQKPLDDSKNEFTDEDLMRFEESQRNEEYKKAVAAKERAEKRAKQQAANMKRQMLSEGEDILGRSRKVRAREAKPRLLSGISEGNTERYAEYVENPFGLVKESPLTTFSIDVDTASYTNLRRKLMNGYLPNKHAVRIEEMINYFDYDYPQPEQGRPFSVSTEVADCPWTEGNKLVKIGLQGKEIKIDKRPSSNLVFLIDVSGSMSSSDKLPLLKEGFQKMVAQLNEKDRVGIVVYAGNAGVVLDPTICDERGRDLIIGALGRLNSGGSTNGAGGIREAYQLVQKNFIQGGTNRVILATDGDFNVGVSGNSELIALVKEKAKQKAYLTVLGFGQGNLNDSMMEEISNQGNGNYYYIDSAKEGTKVLCERISGTLVTIAKDVKIQVEFNPALVHSYRLIGYDNRKLKNEDFNDDKKDAGEIGAGHSVTALYEIVPAGSANARPKVDDLKYQPVEKKEEPAPAGAFSDELMTVKLRYKSPEGGPSTLMKHPVKTESTKFGDASKDFIFSSSVAAFGMLLKSSEYVGDASFEDVIGWIERSKATKDNEDKIELLNLLKQANRLKIGK